MGTIRWPFSFGFLPTESDQSTETLRHSHIQGRKKQSKAHRALFGEKAYRVSQLFLTLLLVKQIMLTSSELTMRTQKMENK